MINVEKKTRWTVRETMLIVALVGSVSGPLHAEEFDVSGVVESKNDHNVQPITESHIILLASMEQTIKPDDAGSPWSGASGPCGGAVEIKGQEITGQGFCTITDVEGDRFVIFWTAQSMNEQGGPIGIWELAGGAGKYSEATADGTYNDVPSDDPARSTIALTGRLTIP